MSESVVWMLCPRCGREMAKEYLFTRFSDTAEYYHYVCDDCGFEHMLLRMVDE